MVLDILDQCRINFECVWRLYCMPKQKLSFSTFLTSMCGANRSGSGHMYAVQSCFAYAEIHCHRVSWAPPTFDVFRGEKSANYTRHFTAVFGHNLSERKYFFQNNNSKFFILFMISRKMLRSCLYTEKMGGPKVCQAVVRQVNRTVPSTARSTLL